ncbi:hypothetical protein [Pseudoalteromonas sp.]|uniref:hypothetical protein n=1 Tax=Pseudoalteromonas sp. TaxID=53249 RepID=UPI003564AE02
MLERRHHSPGFNEHIDLLSDEQRIAMYDLSNYGYDLAFVRTTGHLKIAVLRQGDSVATIDHFGEVNVNPNIALR